jgi:hypothetical protein
MSTRLQATTPGLPCSRQIKNWHVSNLPPTTHYEFGLPILGVDPIYEGTNNKTYFVGALGVVGIHA